MLANVVYVSVVVEFAVFAIFLHDKGFLTSFNLLNVLDEAAPIAIVAMGMVLVLSIAEVDLSVGSLVALSAVVTAMVLRDVGLVPAILAGLGVGVGVGLLNGVLVAVARVPSFLVTLAGFLAVDGLTRQISDNQAIAVDNTTFANVFGGGHVGRYSVLLIWAIVVIAIGQFLYRHTRFGAHVLATGDDQGAAKATGINTTRVRIAVFAISGLMAALAGQLYAGELRGAQYTLGSVTVLESVFAAVTIGGTSLFGGRGSVFGAGAGAVLLSMLQNGFILMGISPAGQQIALGVAIVVSVLLGRTGGAHEK
jgi:ribose transport system permease protein